MWGQGLETQGKFKELFRAALEFRLSKTVEFMFDLSRSGAKILADGDDRPEFVNTYPNLFHNHDELTKFLSGESDAPAARLYGELPNTFPTVRGQLKMMPDAVARSLDIVLLDGGINDIPLRQIADATSNTGTFIEAFGGAIETSAYNDVLNLVAKVREKCPAALIMYFGFFPILSAFSDTSRMKALLKWQYGDDILWWGNENIYTSIDVNQVIWESVARSQWLSGEWQYHTRRAINAANGRPELRGPGIVYVPSGFSDVHSALATSSWLWDSPQDPKDPVRSTREAAIPRLFLLDNYRQAFRALSSSPGSSTGVVTKQLAIILAQIGNPTLGSFGPTSMVNSIVEYLQAPTSSFSRQQVMSQLRGEMDRILNAQIASTFHPNAQGSYSYFNAAVERYTSHIERQAQYFRGTMQLAGNHASEELLKRFGLRTNGELSSDLIHLDVDSIRIEIATNDSSSTEMVLPVFLVIKLVSGEERCFQINFDYYFFVTPIQNTTAAHLKVKKFYRQFEPGSTTSRTFATANDLRLQDIVSAHIVVGDDPIGVLGVKVLQYSKAWRPSYIGFEVNGFRVRQLGLPNVELGPRSQIDLGWPDTNPDFEASGAYAQATMKRVSDWRPPLKVTPQIDPARVRHRT